MLPQGHCKNLLKNQELFYSGAKSSLELMFNEKFNLVLPCYGTALKRTCSTARNQGKFISHSFEELGHSSVHGLQLYVW